MKIQIIKTLILTMVVFTFGCAEFSPSETAEQLEVKNYFDLKGFFESEMERMAGHQNFRKAVFINGESEVDESSEIDFEKELIIFSNSDINRPAWSDKYSVDSIFNEQKELVHIKYETADKKLRTRKMTIDLSGGAVSKIEIENVTSTAIANAQQSLIYEPAKGYAIESRQQVKTVDDVILRIEVSF